MAACCNASTSLPQECRGRARHSSRPIAVLDARQHQTMFADAPFTAVDVDKDVAAVGSVCSMRSQAEVNLPAGAVMEGSAAMPKANRGGWKTCSRGHKYRGLSFCPT